MEYQDIWFDCINKLSDLGYEVDALSEDLLPTLPLIKDSVNGPVIVKIMKDVSGF